MKSFRFWTVALVGILLLLTVGLACRKTSEVDKSIAKYTEAVRLNPNFVVAYWGRGGCYKAKADKAKAEADFAQAKKLGFKGP